MTGYTTHPFETNFFLKFFSYYQYCVRISGTWGETSKHRRINMGERLTKEQKRKYAKATMQGPPTLKAKGVMTQKERAKHRPKGKKPSWMTQAQWDHQMGLIEESNKAAADKS